MGNDTYKIIGLVGKKRAGKDTFFNAVQAAAPPGRVVRVAFADALKDEVFNMLDAEFPGQINREYFDSHKEEFRGLLQWWGQFRRQQSGADYWIKRCFTTLERVQESAAYHGNLHPWLFIITDVRMINEAEAIAKRGGQLIRIRAVNFPEQEKDNHISETEQDSILVDRLLENWHGKQQVFEYGARIQAAMLCPELEKHYLTSLTTKKD